MSPSSHGSADHAFASHPRAYGLFLSLNFVRRRYVTQQSIVYLRPIKHHVSWPVPVFIRCCTGDMYTGLPQSNTTTKQPSDGRRSNSSRRGGIIPADSKASSRRIGGRPLRRVTTMVFIVTVVFVVCWTPYHVNNFVGVYNLQQHVSRDAGLCSCTSGQSRLSFVLLVLLNPLKCSGIGQLHLKLFSAVQV